MKVNKYLRMVFVMLRSSIIIHRMYKEGVQTKLSTWVLK